MKKRKGQEALDLFAPMPPPEPNLTRFDWIVVSTSAGKDSQAMLDLMCERAEKADVLSRVVAVHCDLGRVEWAGTREIAEAQAVRYGIRFEVVRRGEGLLEQIEARGMFPGPETRFCTAHHKENQSRKLLTRLVTETRAGDLLSQVEGRGKWPDSENRYCTSDHKRAQGRRVYTALATETRGGPGKGFGVGGRVRILSCLGMRADESPKRAKLRPLTLNKKRKSKRTGKWTQGASNGRRAVWDYLPLHHWTQEEVWARIKASRTADLTHYCYSLGMPRCSCVFCIYAPREASIVAGHHNRKLLDEYCRVEEKIGHRFKVNLAMAEVRRAVEAGEMPVVTDWKM